MKTVLILLAGLPLCACAGGMSDVLNNRACTTRVNGEVAFGSITPTGKVKFSAVCKPGELLPPPVTEVPAPPVTEDVKPPA
jgi:hypothetical protein